MDEEFLAEQKRIQALPKEELAIYSYDVLTVRISLPQQCYFHDYDNEFDYDYDYGYDYYYEL